MAILKTLTTIVFSFCYRPLTKEQRAIPNALLQFSIKDKDLFGISNQYIAECFILFDEIAKNDIQQQIHLKLNRPICLGTQRIVMSIRMNVHVFVLSFQNRNAFEP